MFYLPMEQHPIFCILHDCAGVCVSACPWRLRDLPRLCSPWCHGWRGAAAERSSSGPSLGTWLCLQLIVGRGGALRAEGAALRMREIVYKYWTQVLQWQTHNGEVEPQPGYTSTLTHNSHCCYCLA